MQEISQVHSYHALHLEMDTVINSIHQIVTFQKTQETSFVNKPKNV